MKSEVSPFHDAEPAPAVDVSAIASPIFFEFTA